MAILLVPHDGAPRVPDVPVDPPQAGRALRTAERGLRPSLRQAAPAAIVAPAAPAATDSPATIGTFEDIYEAHFDFVWKAVRRLGVPPASVDDAVQDVFVVVHRRAAGFEGRSSLRTWLFGIVVHVARAHRRRRSLATIEDPDAVVDPRAPNPHACAEAAEAKRMLHEVLDTLDDEPREVFVLIELSGMTAPEAAETLGRKLNTVYSQLRAARSHFDAEVERRAVRDGWRLT